MSNKSQYCISPIAAAVSAALAAPAAVLAQEEDASNVLDVIIVTATKRDEDLQKIPASIHALPEAMLKEMGALNTEDYVRLLPSVNFINFNTGGNNFIVFRGVNTTTGGFTGRQSSSIYLDEIPLTATDGSSPDLRMLDVARVEALAGPQGTLFGAAAQAGTLRYITNKPDTSAFEGSAEVSISTGSTSDRSHNITAVFNVPLIEDVFAIRLAALSATDGGFIDNVLGHMPDNFSGTAPSGTRSEWGSHLNGDVAEENWNSVDFSIFRISARWEINDRWAATASYNYGDTNSQGNNAYNPFVGDLQTISFVKNTSRSEWDVSSLLIEGDLGFAQIVSSTSYFENQRTFVIDNTLYYKYYLSNYCGDAGPADGTWSGYQYDWENPATGRIVYYPLYCPSPAAGSPSGDVTKLPDMPGIGAGPEWQDRFSQEIRLTHQGERFDWLAGLYYEDANDSWNSIWMKSSITPYQDSLSYSWIVNGLAPGGGTAGIAPYAPAAAVVAEGLADHYWDSRDDTDWEQKAVFGEVTWHATDAVDVTFGGRWFETTNDKLYIKYVAAHTDGDGRATGGFIQPRWIGNDIVQTRTLSEFVPKLSVTYNIDDNKMMYGLYTEGFRVGGINRANKNADWSRTLFGQEWDPDKLKNYEIGLKSRWADNTVQLNLTAFYMDWEDFQTETVDPSSNTCVDPAFSQPMCGPDGELPWLSIVGNAGDAHTAGVTAELDWVPADRWHVGANLQWLEAETDDVLTGPSTVLESGLQLPNVPDLQGALWARYAWPVQFIPGAEMFIRGQYSYTGETTTKLIPAPLTSNNPGFTNESYGLANLRMGLIAPDGSWSIDVFVNNVTDERAQIFQGSSGAWNWGRTGEYDRWHSVYTVRPREYGVRFSSSWGD